MPSDHYTSRLTTITLPDRQRGDGGGVTSEKSRIFGGRLSGASHGCSAEKQSWTFDQYLYHLAEMELADRHRRRIQRQLKQSRLPGDKTLALLETDRLPAKVRRQLSTLCTGEFVDQAENVLAFGLPGRGKTHLVVAVGHELIQQGYSVYFTPTYQLVQRLLPAKRDLLLEKELRRLDRFDVVILDDLGYVQQDRDEMEVLFTFLGERYERRSKRADFVVLDRSPLDVAQDPLSHIQVLATWKDGEPVDHRQVTWDSVKLGIRALMGD